MKKLCFLQNRHCFPQEIISTQKTYHCCQSLTMFWRTVSIISVSSIMASLAMLAVALRFVARHITHLPYDADDYLVVIGLVCCSLDYAMMKSSRSDSALSFSHSEYVLATLWEAQLGDLVPMRLARVATQFPICSLFTAKY